MSRALRSVAMRNALYLQADGLCSGCGVELSGGWHADHILPWSKGGKTEFGNMQALCPACNLRKGAKVMKSKRKHQAELELIAQKIATGVWTAKRIVADVTPGGGKTGAGALFAKKLLESGIVDRVAWICPRASLRTQVEIGFPDPDFNPGNELRVADNAAPLVRQCRGHNVVGYTTTYQSIVSQPNVHEEEFRRHRYLLILDEPHHLAEKKSWSDKMKTIEGLASVTLLMSGTIERNDRERIPFMDYVTEGGIQVPRADVKYSRKDALREEAVLPIAFHWADGLSRYYHDKQEKSIELSQASEEEVGRAICTAVTSDEYVFSVVDACIEKWKQYQSDFYKSKAIVVCEGQKIANRVLKYLKNQGVDAVLAISELPDADKVIEAFRDRGRGDVLITVGMAHEGMDVPECTHMAFLTDIRSEPWIEQAFARVTRFNRKCGLPYESQWAHIWVPDDPKMRSVVEAMRAEQSVGLKEVTPKRLGDGLDRPRESTFAPIDATLTNTRLGTLDRSFNSQQSKTIEAVQNSVPEARKLSFEAIAAIINVAASYQPPVTPQYNQPQTLSQKEAEARRVVDSLTKKLDVIQGTDFGTTNKELCRIFRKTREKMGIDELGTVRDYLMDKISALESNS